MIKVILLKDAEAGRSVVFAKAVVENNGFSIDMIVGYIKKTKDNVSKAGTIAMELPDVYLDKLKARQETFTTEEGEERTVTYIAVN